MPLDEIGRIFLRHMTSYMGEAVEMSSGSENWWVHWRHIRKYFYVYSYSSGILISKTIQAEVRKNPEFIQKVKDFLSAGTSASPQDIFERLGIDITKKEFWEKGIEEFDYWLKEAQHLADKLGKRD